nr:hypothetical protein [Kibdelosporangium sp. MJ126-NF4]CTQ98584.1 hypothetical protein [Kibdelosporangium sp. MJ126-NF4]
MRRAVSARMHEQLYSATRSRHCRRGRLWPVGRMFLAFLLLDIADEDQL